MDASKQVITCKEFIEKYYLSELLANTNEGRFFLSIDFLKFSIFDPELAHLLLEKPEDVIKAAELAIEQFDLEKDKSIKVRFFNIPQKEIVFIRNIRSKHLGKFVVIQGIVRQKSDVRPQIEKAKFECPSCGTIISLSQSEKTITEPKKCHSCGYKGKFSLIDKDLSDMQAMVLEEATDILEGGEQPKRLNILLKDDLVSPISDKKTNPGSNIRIYGILKEIAIESRNAGKNLTKYDLVLHANNIEPLEEDFSNIKITPEEKKKIIELSQDQKVFEKLTKALAPGIYGHDKVKEAILLLFFGGVLKKRSDGVKNRGDTHILLIGDPGSGKSQLLKRAEVIAPKGKYVSGKGASGAGLTASVVKDEFLGGWALEAGALPLSNKGYCLEGNTEILLDDGRCIPIKELYAQIKDSKKMKVLSFNEKTFKLEAKTIKNASKRKANDLQKIVFASKDILHITNEHPLPTWNNGLIWKKVSEIKEGDFIIDFRNYPSKTSNSFVLETGRKNKIILTKEYAEFLGLLITDGSLGRTKNNIVFYTKNTFIEKRYTLLVKKLFGISTTTYVDKRSGVKQLYFSSKKVMQDCIDLKIPRGQKSKKLSKTLINQSLPQNILFSYLTGIINGDGSISNKKGGGAIDIICGTEEFTKQLQSICRKCGVIGNVNTLHQKGGGIIKKGNYTNFSLTITGISNLKKFESCLFEPKKKKALLDILKRKDNSGRVYNINTLFNDINTTLPKNKKNLLYKNGIKQSQLKKWGVNRNTLHKTILELEKNNIKHKNIDLLKEILKKQIYFNKVITITPEKPNVVYNIEVADNNTYFANFIPTHNCIIDELDKMSTEDTSAMHEALEQQSVSISKANIQATLRCETTVLAAANPKLGRFDPFEPLAKQINLPPALINRFDLIFPFRDEPDEQKDEMLARFVLGMHKNSEVDIPEVETDLLRKYIMYARQNIHPVITENAITEIKDFYVKMRNSNVNTDNKAIPISARQLEALVRLTEASAKSRLSTKATKRDARRAIDLLHFCLQQVGFDTETGQFDIDQLTTGVSTRQRNKAVVIRELIKEIEEKVGKTFPIEDLIKAAELKGISADEVDEAVEKLKRSGDIYSPKPDFISRI